MTTRSSFVDESEVTSLSPGQQKVLAVISIPSALLSIMGSSLIVYLIIGKRWSRRNNGHPIPEITPYRRILLGLSLCDIVCSVGAPLQYFLTPSKSQRTWAFGNDKSCTVLGFWWQISYSTFWYYGMLSFYYLATIRFGVSEKKFGQRFEPIVHSLSVGFPLVTAVVGAGMGIFSVNELGPGCWVNDYPRNCGSDPTETGETCISSLIAWIIGGIPILAMLAAIIVNNSLVYLHVRRTIYRSRRRSSFSQNDTQIKRVRAVATQAFLYVAAFLVAYTGAMAIRILEGNGFDAVNEDKIYILLLANAGLTPMAGFFNLLVYLRPRYLRVRGDFPDESRTWAVRRALFGDVVEPGESRDQVPTRATEAAEPPAVDGTEGG